VNRYASAAAFKQALENRLRFLARIVSELGDSAMIKGGLVVELRVERARTTKDIDLRLVGPRTGILERLQRAARLDLGEFMVFTVAPDTEHPEITNEGMVYEGQRYRVTCALAGKPYGQTFGLDIAFADPILGEPDVVVADDVLGFAAIAPPSLRLYPIETHIAEKLHAYTLPRKRQNSRVKDLPDMALLAGVREIESAQLRRALEQTFTSRKTHAVPAALPAPPPAWVAPYARMVEEDELRWADLATLARAVEAFLNPVLDGTAPSTWAPSTWRWGP
jgi:hypothetical protein